MKVSNRLEAEQRNGRRLNVRPLFRFMNLQNVSVGCLCEALDSFGKKYIYIYMNYLFQHEASPQTF